MWQNSKSRTDSMLNFVDRQRDEVNRVIFSTIIIFSN